MNYYKKPNGSIWAFEIDGTQDHLISSDMVPCAMPTPTVADITNLLVNSVQMHIDAAAQALGYDDIRTAVTYADESSVPRFQAEGKALRAWRSLCWDYCNSVIDAVMSGKRKIPTSVELIAGLPKLQKAAA